MAAKKAQKPAKKVQRPAAKSKQPAKTAKKSPQSAQKTKPVLPPRPRGRQSAKYGVGTIHNKLEVIERIGEWMRKCRCLKCGNVHDWSTTYLQQGGRCNVCHPKKGRVGRPPKKKAKKAAKSS